MNNELSQSYIRKHSGDYKISTDELAALLRDRSDHLDYELLDNYTIEDLDIDSVEDISLNYIREIPIWDLIKWIMICFYNE